MILKGIVRQLLGQLHNIIAGNPSEQARESNPRLLHVGFEPASPKAEAKTKSGFEPSTFRLRGECTTKLAICAMHIHLEKCGIVYLFGALWA